MKRHFKCSLDEQQCGEECHGNTKLKEKCEFCTVTIVEENHIITSRKDLIELVKSGQFFNFCVAFALNKGFRNAIKEKKEVKFTVGDYVVEFKHDGMCFVLEHQVYFARIISAHPDGEVYFVGDDEKEVINDLLTEAEKEFKE